MGDRLLIVVMSIIIGGYLYMAASLPKLSFAGPIGPRTFPLLIGLLGLFALGLLVVERARKRQTPAAEPSAGTPRRPLAIIAFTAWTFIYYLVFEPLGYVVATIPYLLVLMIVFNRGRWIANVSVSVLFTVGTYVVFNKYLQLNLPAGILGF